MQSGSGKTIVSCGLMTALKKRGLSVAGFKCGPDYIDPMFHTRVLGIPSRNLDLYLQGEAGVRRTLEKTRADIAVLEGAMGFYDGVNRTSDASAWDVARVTDTPVILVLRPSGQSLSLAAQIRGMQAFREPSHIAGLLLNNVKPSMYKSMKEMLERETGLPVVGFLPPMEEAVLSSRHLGLVTAEEITDICDRFEAVAEAMEQYADLDKLLSLAAGKRMDNSLFESPAVFGEAVHDDFERTNALKTDAGCEKKASPLCRIAAARDEAFSFYYQDNLDALAAAGAEIVSFSPIHDARLPEADGLYLGGGYPELYKKELSGNASMRDEIRTAVKRGMPVVAECGGFLYLQQDLCGTDPMAGVLPGSGFRTEHLRRFGYLTLRAESDSLLFRAGEEIPAHEFHYWDSSDCGDALAAWKADGRSWRCGFTSDTMYAAFPHLHWGGKLPMAERFVRAAVRYHEGKSAAG